MSDSQHTLVVPLYLLVSGIKYSLSILLSLTFLNILLDWNDSIDKVSKPLKETALRRLGHESSYRVICGAPLYIQVLLTDTFSDEKETNFNVLGKISTWLLPIIFQYNDARVVLVNNIFHYLVSMGFHKIPCSANSRHVVMYSNNI